MVFWRCFGGVLAVFSAAVFGGVFAVFSQCFHDILAVFSQCFRGVFAVFSRCLAVFLRCFGGFFAVFSQCFRGVFAVFYFVCLFYMKKLTKRNLGKRTVKRGRGKHGGGKHGGGKHGGGKRRTTRLLPKLKKSLNNRKRYHYKLDFKPRGRRMAINEGIRYETKRGRSVRPSNSEKGRLTFYGYTEE